jgi:hypothetical protein
MRMKIVFKKTTKFAQILGILNNNFKPTVVQKFSKIKVHNTVVILILVYRKEIWALRVKDKITDIIREEILQKNSRVHPL